MAIWGLEGFFQTTCFRWIGWEIGGLSRVFIPTALLKSFRLRLPCITVSRYLRDLKLTVVPRMIGLDCFVPTVMRND